MSFSWTRFLSEHQVEHRAAGAHNIEVRCPWCGEGDPSMHLAISTRGRGYRCFRNSQHNGKNHARLIQGLIRCTWERACELAGYEAAPSVDDEDLPNALATMLGMSTPPPKAALQLPKEFKDLNNGSILSNPFWDYLLDRGLSWAEVRWAIEHYQLHYCTKGAWAGRIIVPIQDERGKLMTWTARSIRSDAPIRYKTLASDAEEGPSAVKPPGHLLLGLPLLWAAVNPRVLVLCEGPFDAIRVSCAGHQRGVYGTCLFGLSISQQQVELVEQLGQRFPKLRLLLDEDAQLIVLGVLERLAALKVQAARLPEGVKDPGALRAFEAEALVGDLLAA